MDLPQYTLKPNTNRMVVPWIFKLLALSALFYVGIFFNVRIVFDASIPTIINIFIVLTLLVLIIVQVILYNVKFGKYRYLFFTNRIEFQGKKVMTFYFSDFNEFKIHRNVFDSMFNTGTIDLSKKFHIGPISNPIQVKNYLDRLIKYYQYSQQQQRMRDVQQKAYGQQPQQGV